MILINTTHVDNSNFQLSPQCCAADILEQNTVNRPLHTQERQKYSNYFFNRVVSAYQGSQVYRTYRKEFIAIKVNKPTATDRVSDAVKELDQYARSNGIVIASSARGHIIYRIPA